MKDLKKNFQDKDLQDKNLNKQFLEENKNLNFSYTEDDEILDIVDDNDNVISQARRWDIFEKTTNFRSVNAFIVNSENLLWIPRRSALKKTVPLGLDMSVSGCVKSGESYEEAFKRELKEELNLDANQVDYRVLGFCTPEKHNVRSFMTVYEIKFEEEPNYNRDEICEGFWFEPKKLAELILSGHSAKSGLIKLLNIFYL